MTREEFESKFGKEAVRMIDQISDLIAQQVTKIQEANKPPFKKPFVVFVGAHSDWVEDHDGKKVTRPGDHSNAELLWIRDALNAYSPVQK